MVQSMNVVFDKFVHLKSRAVRPLSNFTYHFWCCIDLLPSNQAVIQLTLNTREGECGFPTSTKQT